jgi:hypothetical protein
MRINVVYDIESVEEGMEAGRAEEGVWWLLVVVVVKSEGKDWEAENVDDREGADEE